MPQEGIPGNGGIYALKGIQQVIQPAGIGRPGSIAEGRYIEVELLQPRLVFSQAGHQVAAAGAKAEPGGGALLRGGLYAEGFQIVLQGHIHSVGIPHLQASYFQNAHQGGDVLASFKDFGRILGFQRYVSAADKHVPVGYVQRVYIGLQGQDPRSFFEGVIQGVPLGLEIQKKGGNVGRQGVRPVLDVHLAGFQVGRNGGIPDAGHIQLGQPGFSLDVCPQGTGSQNTHFAGKGVGERVYARLQPAVQPDERVFSQHIPGAGRCLQLGSDDVQEEGFHLAVHFLQVVCGNEGIQRQGTLSAQAFV